MKQLDFVKGMMLVMGLTIQADQYTPHLRLAPGNKLLANISRARDWTAKRDAYAVPGRLPERDLGFRFGDYGQLNRLLWEEDEQVTPGYGDGSIAVADEVLPTDYDMATLPFAATQISKQVPGLLQLLNFEASDLTVSPPTYDAIEAKPRLVLRPDGPIFHGQLIMVPATPTTAAVMASYTSVASYFDSFDLSLVLDKTVLTDYWADMRAALDETRVLTENFRLTAQDISQLDYSLPIWLGDFGDYFLLSKVSEFDARRSTEIVLIRLNAKHLPPPVIPGVDSKEWYSLEWYGPEWY
ncbi:MAG: hypothetical protein EOO63_07220 [Hymenobacter sp.]|nr:MAG: hypothetical protein EOO63_07220 [Hymenobacter sp.]